MALSLSWSSSLDGLLGTGRTLTAILGQGTHVITLTVEDELGASDTDTVTISVQPGQGVPSAEILEPVLDAAFLPGETVTLKGRGSDPEDGELPGSQLYWYSDRDGFLGTGRELEVQLSGEDCFVLDEVITLRVTDSDGNSAETKVHVFVGFNC